MTDAPRTRVHRPYCLPLEQVRAARRVCPRCDYVMQGAPLARALVLGVGLGLLGLGVAMPLLGQA